MREDNVCRICSSPESFCGLTVFNHVTRSVLAEMFEIQVEENSLSCVDCLVFLEKAVGFKEIVKFASFVMQNKVKVERDSDDDWSMTCLDESEAEQEKIRCIGSGCRKKFSKKVSMKLHYNREHKVQDGKKGGSKKRLLWLCNCCNKAITGSNFEHYQKVHKNLTKKELKKLQTECKICGQKYLLKNSLSKHKKRAHPEMFQDFLQEEEKEFAPKFVDGKGCSCCGRTYAIKIKLSKHRFTKHRSTVRKEFVCSICNENVPNLTHHYKTNHKGLDPEKKHKLIKCNVCYATVKLSRLLIHKRFTHPKCFKYGNNDVDSKYAPQYEGGKGWRCCGKFKLVKDRISKSQMLQTSKRGETQNFNVPHL